MRYRTDQEAAAYDGVGPTLVPPAGKSAKSSSTQPYGLRGSRMGSEFHYCWRNASRRADTGAR